MSDSRNTDNKKNNNISRLFAVLIIIIVIALFTQGIYIHKIMKQIEYLSEKQTQTELLERKKPPVILNQKTKINPAIKKFSSGKDDYLSKKLAKLLNSMNFSEDNPFSNSLVGINTTSSKITKFHDKYIITFLTPGINKKNISINALNNVLTIIISKNNTSSTDTATTQQQSYSEFTESMLIPSDVDSSKIVSKHENGILTITLPRQATNQVNTKIINIE